MAALARQAPAVVPRFGRRARPRRAAVARAASAAARRAADADDDGVQRGGVEVPAALALCLHLARHPEGADVLRCTSLLHRLAVLCEQLSVERREPGSEYAYDPERAYRLCLRVAATLADSMASVDKRSGGLRSMLVSFATAGSLPNRLEDALRPCEITSDSLAEAEASAGFYHALARAAEANWQIDAPGNKRRARAAAAAFLQWIASPPARRGVHCAPRTEAERFAQSSPALVGCSTGWFHSLSVGSSPVSSVGSAAIAAAVAASSDAPVGNKHSEALAARVYATAARCAAFLSSFPRVDTSTAVGADALESLERQAVALKMEVERRVEGGKTSENDQPFAKALKNIADTLFQSTSHLTRLEDGETVSPNDMFSTGSGKLNHSFSLITQMSWRATPSQPTLMGSPR